MEKETIINKANKNLEKQLNKEQEHAHRIAKLEIIHQIARGGEQKKWKK